MFFITFVYPSVTFIPFSDSIDIISFSLEQFPPCGEQAPLLSKAATDNFWTLLLRFFYSLNLSYGLHTFYAHHEHLEPLFLLCVVKKTKTRSKSKKEQKIVLQLSNQETHSVLPISHTPYQVTCPIRQLAVDHVARAVSWCFCVASSEHLRFLDVACSCI